MSSAAPAPAGAGPGLAAVPRATLRLQLSPTFGFEAATAIVPTLAALGVSHVYLSPILMARPGSDHGYDIIDHGRLNPELGGEEGFQRFSDALLIEGLGLIVDFVPNHMGIGVSENRWWRDVLEWGRDSPHADWFDIDWEPAEPSLHGKILLPVLGDHYGAILERGELSLRFDAETGGFVVRYYEHAFPIRPHDYGDILRRGMTPDRPEDDVLALVIATADALRATSAAAPPPGAGGPDRRKTGAVLKRRLAELMATNAETRAVVAAAEAAFVGEPGRPSSFDDLDALIERQSYRPAFWRVAAHEINYRRFFEINDLAALRMERSDLFDTAHRLLFDLVADGRVQGIRLDHVDGLWDPDMYFRRLQAEATGALTRGRKAGTLPPAPDDEAAPLGLDQPAYVVVEKILAPHERLRESWPIAGSTGYEFMNQVLGLLIDPAGEPGLMATYGHILGRPEPFDAIVRAAKRQIMEESLASEIGVMANRLNRLAKRARTTKDYSRMALRAALINVIAHFPVYRTYVNPFALREGAHGPDEAAARIDDQDRRDLQWAIGRARKAARTPDVSIYDFLYDVFTADLALAGAGHPPDEVLDLAMRVQQLTSPVMAKAMEDTAFYRFVPLAALNEVGGEPDRFGVSTAAFHHANQARLENWPFSMLATATHDHKRGEDARARLAVISECPDLWGDRVARWGDLNQRRVTTLSDGRRAPSANDEYLFYQTVLATWPLDMPGASQPDDEPTPLPDEAALAAYADRIATYMIKAAREAKLDTAWTAQDPDYEAGLDGFVRAVLSSALGGAFVLDMAAFATRLAPTGAVNSLAQTALKLTVPGVPDIYQGTDLWDFSLVDPDNRRPVDFAARARMLAEGLDPTDLLADWRNGRVKQALMARLLDLRRRHPTLFSHGTYGPMDATGERSQSVLAFARVAPATAEDGTSLALVVVAPRLVWPMMADAATPLPPPAAWGDTALRLPAEADWASAPARDILTGGAVSPGPDGTLPLAGLLDRLPVAVLAFGEGA
jgi:(1->4)-alpha-D-glucan 1-alpha-D-glucosylmutase